MRTVRLTKCVEIVRLWPFFVQGLTFVSQYLRYTLPLETYRQILQHAVKQPNFWVGVCFEDDGETPICFSCAHETTPMFSNQREFEVSMLYHQPGRHDALIALQQAFDKFCRKENVTRYYVTTRGDSSNVIRCFRSARYGLKRAYTVYKKEF